MVRPEGKWRTRRPRPLEDDAKTSDGNIENWVRESLYRTRDYKPPFDDLPWKDDAGNDA